MNLWYICFSCRQGFPKVAELLKHKRSKHVGNKGVRISIFTQDSLLPSIKIQRCKITSDLLLQQPRRSCTRKRGGQLRNKTYYETEKTFLKAQQNNKYQDSRPKPKCKKKPSEANGIIGRNLRSSMQPGDVSDINLPVHAESADLIGSTANRDQLELDSSYLDRDPFTPGDPDDDFLIIDFCPPSPPVSDTEFIVPVDINQIIKPPSETSEINPLAIQNSDSIYTSSTTKKANSPNPLKRPLKAMAVKQSPKSNKRAKKNNIESPALERVDDGISSEQNGRTDRIEKGKDYVTLYAIKEDESDFNFWPGEVLDFEVKCEIQDKEGSAIDQLLHDESQSVVKENVEEHEVKEVERRRKFRASTHKSTSVTLASNIDSEGEYDFTGIDIDNDNDPDYVAEVPEDLPDPKRKTKRKYVRRKLKNKTRSLEKADCVSETTEDIPDPTIRTKRKYVRRKLRNKPRSLQNPDNVSGAPEDMMPDPPIRTKRKYVRTKLKNNPRSLVKKIIKKSMNSKEYKCDICNKIFVGSQPSGLTRHRRVEHGINTFGQLCNICGKYFKFCEGLKLHMQSVHGDGNFQCSECGTSFKSEVGLKRHSLTHSNSCFKCSICRNLFRHEERLKRHLLVRHSDSDTKIEKQPLPPVKCPDCGRSFKFPQYLKNHKIRCHDPPDISTIHPCNLCGKKYSSDHSLRAHLSHSHPKEPKVSVPCPTCGKLFGDIHLMKCHAKRIHTEGKPYACTHCPARFKIRHCLTRHQICHNNKGRAKPFQCVYCLKHISSELTLNEHIKNLHTDRLTDEEFLELVATILRQKSLEN